MKILIIINNLGVGGAERLVIDSINSLIKRGVDVSLLTLRSENPKSTLSYDLNINPSNWKKILFESIYDVKSWFKLISLIIKLSPDVVITHLWFSNTIGRIAAKICRVKNIVSFEHNVYDSVKTKKMFVVDRVLQNTSNYIIAVSLAVKNSLIKNGIRSDKIELIYNGIDISKYGYERNTPNNPFKFIFIGRLINQKGVDVLIRAFKDVHNSTLQIVGRGKEEESLKRIVNELGLGHRVTFLGIRKDIAKLLCEADCFVLPSRYEGLPMVLLEAMASKIPIILSNFTSASEMIVSGENGTIVQKESEKELSAAMEKMRQDCKYREMLISNLKKMHHMVSIDNHVNKLLATIN